MNTLQNVFHSPRYIRISIILIIAISFGCIQYLPQVAESTFRGDNIWWTIGDDVLSNTPIYQQISKEVFLLLICCFWPSLYIKSYYKAAYFWLWVSSVVAFGLVSYAVGNGVPMFLVAGFRWILLLIASGALYFKITIDGWDYKDQKYLYRFLLLLGIICLAFSTVQLFYSENIVGARVPSIFSQAGITGYFTVSIILISTMINSYNLTKIATLQTIFFFVSIASGTRFAIIINSIIILYTIIKYLEQKMMKKSTLYAIFALIAPIVGSITYYLAVVFVNRGNFSEQFSDNSRSSNLLLVLKAFENSAYVDFLFGRGIGIATNTSVTIAKRAWYSNDWNFTIDNTIAQSFLQFGFLGSIVLWWGAAVIFFSARKRSPWYVSAFVILFLFVQNIFEQYFVMICISTYWGYLNNRYPYHK